VRINALNQLTNNPIFVPKSKSKTKSAFLTTTLHFNCNEYKNKLYNKASKHIGFSIVIVCLLDFTEYQIEIKFVLFDTDFSN
jgi:hypothetical protein